VLLSTHDLDEVHRLCDRVAIIDGGKILAVARPADLIAGSRQASRLHIRTARPLAADQCRALAGTGACTANGDSWVLESTDVTRTVADLMRRLETAGNELLDLQIRRPTLEDVFLELTGHAWPGKENAEDET
jgi:ABC-2 type transport system ATP-binding protein